MRQVLAIAILFCAPATAELFDSIAASNVKVAMRDGVKLSTDIYRPAKRGIAVAGRFPTLIARSPYNKAGERGLAEFMARNGFVFVAQDVRGRYESEGSLAPLVQEPADGYDTIEWAAAQPWSNGKIGTIGASYLAIDQMSAATLKPPHLAAMYLAVGSYNYYCDAGYRGGIPGTNWPLWLLFSASTSPRGDASKQRLSELLKEPNQWLLRHQRDREKVFHGFPDQLRSYREFYRHPHLDDYWKERGRNPAAYFNDLPDIPMMFVGGWYDSLGDSTADAFVALSRLQKTTKRLIIGPWPHAYGKSVCGDAAFGSDAELAERKLQLDWFDETLNGAPSAGRAVRYYRIGGGAGERNAAGKFEPGANGSLPSDGLHGEPKRSSYTSTLAAASRSAHPAAAEPTVYTFDPNNPAPTLGGRYRAECIQNQNIRRPDVVSFIGEPLQAATDVTGRVSVRLWVSTDRLDTDFIAKVIDVFPNGYAMNVSEGQLRMRYRSSYTSTSLIEPGKVYDVSIDLGWTSHLFGQGHRIRLDITSSSFPKLEPNPNTGEFQGEITRRLKARNSIHHWLGHPSRVLLPVVR